MRQAFIKALSEKARKDPKVMLIVCDVGFSFIEDFAAEFPNQFINAGVTEQSATGMAAGLAMAGFKPYLYTMIPFVAFRNFEQVRNDIGYNNANVVLVGVKGSVHYKFLGFSHNITEGEDLKVLGVVPNLTCYVPQTEAEITDIILNKSGPAYIRL